MLKNSCRSGDNDDTVSLHSEDVFAGCKGDIKSPEGVNGGFTLSSMWSTEFTELVERSDVVRLKDSHRSGRGGIGGLDFDSVGDWLSGPAPDESIRRFDDERRRGGTTGLLVYESVSSQAVTLPFEI